MFEICRKCFSFIIPKVINVFDNFLLFAVLSSSLRMLKLNETPSRILRRINEEDKEELMSLPSVDDQDYSGLTETESNETTTQLKENDRPKMTFNYAETPNKLDNTNKTPKDALKRSITQPNVLMSAMKDKAKSNLNTTPFPKTVSFSRNPLNNDSQSIESSFASSNNDLITPRQASENPNESGNRFDGNKLNSYLNSLNQHLTTENQQLVSALENAKEDAFEAQEQLRLIGDEHDAEIDQLRNEVARLKSSKSQTASDEVQKLSYTVDKLQDEVYHYKNRSKQLEEEVGNLDNDRYQLNKELEDTRRTHKDVDGKMEKYEGTIGGLEADIHDIEVEFERRQSIHNSHLEEYKKVNQEMDKHLQSNQIEIESLTSNINKLNEELIQLRSYNQSNSQFTPRNKSKSQTIDITPAVHKSVINLKMPKTPATPEWMGHDTWLNQTTIGAGDVQPLLAQVAALRQQLDGANDEVDRNIRRLGETGLDNGSVVKKLLESSDKVHNLEMELRKVHEGQEEDRKSIEALISERENIVKVSIRCSNSI